MPIFLRFRIAALVLVGLYLPTAPPRPGEVGHDDAANPIAAARPLTASSALARFLASGPPCGERAGHRRDARLPITYSLTACRQRSLLRLAGAAG